MYIVTGGAGFIGSNIVKALNDRGEDVIVVDELTDGYKFENLADCTLVDYLDKDNFLAQINAGKDFGNIKAIFHEGACSTTTEWNGRFMLENNFEYSKQLLHYCLEKKIPLLYASSAAIYGGSETFRVDPQLEKPLNVYGYSKLLFDQYVRKFLHNNESQVVGFRYFNVYGPREQHKASMASVAFHFNHQIKQNGIVRLFESSDGYDNGEQRRDFVFIDDVVDVKLWFAENNKSGIFNIGTGRSQTFNAVANSVIKWHGCGEIQYIPFPEHLRGHYQSFTEADISALRAAGYTKEFHTVEQGVKKYLDRVEGLKEKEKVSVGDY